MSDYLPVRRLGATALKGGTGLVEDRLAKSVHEGLQDWKRGVTNKADDFVDIASDSGKKRGYRFWFSGKCT